MPNAAKKHMQPWSGPHTITGAIDEMHFKFIYSRMGRSVTSYLNRFVRFYPGSDELPSTSPDFDSECAWRASGEIPVDSTVLVEINDDKANSIIPFLVGRFITHPNSPSKENASDPDRISVHWYGNRASNARGSYRPAWRRPDNSISYRSTPQHLVDVAYSSSLLRVYVILHSFPLLPSLRLPNGVLRAAQTSGRSLFDLLK
jgi:hypothetical protein